MKYWCFAVSALFAVGQVAWGQSSGADGEILRAIADAADENRLKFSFGDVAFEFRDGQADSLDAAIRGTLTTGHVASGRYCFNNKGHAFYEKKYPLEALVATTVWNGPNQSSGTLDSFRALTNGKSTLMEQIGPAPDGKSLIFGHVITPGTSDFYRAAADFPLSLGWPSEGRNDLSQHLRSALTGSNSVALEGIEQDANFEGKKVVRLTLKFLNGLTQYWVDLERGAIPLRRHDEIQGGFSYDEALGKIELVPGHGWLPFEQTVYLNGGRTKRLVIQQVKFDQPPPPESFQIETEEARTIADVGAGVAYRARKHWDLDNLPAPTAPGVTPIAKALPVATGARQLPGEREPGPPYFTIGGFAVAGLLAAFYAFRRLRGRSPAGEA